jgi:hypothetical protein
MKAMMLLTGDGAMVVLTSYASPADAGLLRKLEAKGIDKFIAHELPLDLVKSRYGQHFAVVEHDLHESDDLRVLDYSGGRAFRLFRFAEFGPAVAYEQGQVVVGRPEGYVRAAEDVQ